MTEANLSNLCLFGLLPFWGYDVHCDWILLFSYRKIDLNDLWCEVVCAGGAGEEDPSGLDTANLIVDLSSLLFVLKDV